MPFEPTDYLPYDFANRRHIGPSPEEMAAMLKVVGAPSLDALIEETVPKSLRQSEPLDFGKPKSEGETPRRYWYSKSRKTSTFKEPVKYHPVETEGTWALVKS